MSKTHYTCVSKGGEFEVVGTSSGAGPRKGEPLIVYRDLKTGKLHHREPENFAMRMKQLPDVQAQLLAALEGADKAISAALPLLPADGEAVFCGEWLAEIRGAIAAAKGEA